MPSTSKKQQHFFQKVRDYQIGKLSPAEASSAVKKVANSISPNDAEDFARSVATNEMKQVVLNVLKDIREPMYLEEEEINPVAKTFHVDDIFEKYVKRFIGQPFSPKELEAIDTFQEVKPVKIERTEIRYETSDEWQNSTTTTIKKMKDGVEFSYNAFSKVTKTEPEEEPESPPTEPESGPGELPPLGEETTPPAPATPSNEPTEKDDIVITKSVLFKDDIKGAAILVEFLKKLDL